MKIKEKFNANKGKTKFNLEFKSRIVLICGDSGSGKTVLFKTFYRVSKEDENSNIITISSEHFNTPNIDIITEELRDKLEKQNGKFIVIDNADVILANKGLRDFY